MKLREVLRRDGSCVRRCREEIWKFGRWLATRAKCSPRTVFCVHGAQGGRQRFIQDAVARGAVAIAERRAAPARFRQAWHGFRCARRARRWQLPRRIFSGTLRTRLKLVAVTGTNGKTTTTSLVDSIVKASGAKTGLFGTIAYHTPLGDYPAPNTTPESVDLQGFFAEIRDAGGTFAVLEASSHSLAMDRLWGCHFRRGSFHQPDARAHGFSQNV